jgi:FKBP-type peptidyl-prolyl cis-trans isomerase (trigger factor)
VQAKVEVHEIKKVQYPELDDDFAKDAGHDTMDAMNAAVRFRIQEAKDKHARDDAGRKLLRKVIAANAFEVPPQMVEDRGQQLISSIAAQMMPGYQQAPQFSLDDLDDEKKAGLLQEADFVVRRELVLEAVARQEELTISDEEKEARIAQMAQESGQRPETIKGYLMKSGRDRARGRARGRARARARAGTRDPRRVLSLRTGEIDARLSGNPCHSSGVASTNLGRAWGAAPRRTAVLRGGRTTPHGRVECRP